MQRGHAAPRSKEPERRTKQAATAAPEPPTATAARANVLLAPLRPLLPDKAAATEEDPVVEFFAGTDKALTPPPRPDSRASEIDGAVAAKLIKPLHFASGEGEGSGDRTDMGPAIPALSLARHTPKTADTHAVQLGAVTRRVCQLHIAAKASGAAPGPLFADVPPPVLEKTPAHAQTSLRTRGTSAPVR